ncbi:hypothetical protein NPIL_88971, partial [Nephila pilipes]
QIFFFSSGVQNNPYKSPTEMEYSVRRCIQQLLLRLPLKSKQIKYLKVAKSDLRKAPFWIQKKHELLIEIVREKKNS